ncbi:hypothetical protein P3T42_002749 [Paraburkholderia sp. GAS38]|uniref:glycosyltransferase family 39 protein n=1 Tax=Paraburkholderia sp. GAS38 TaxID=3035133 RepID=UPI003D1A36A9
MSTQINFNSPKNLLWSETSQGKIFALFCIVATCLLYNSWLITGHLFFYFDDWNWLELAQFSPWSTYFHVLPDMIYNDRPVGGLFIKIIYQIFFLNHTAFSISFLALHTINCIFLYAIGSRYISRVGALLAAMLAATWLSSLTSLTWSAAVFDVLGATLCLAAIFVRQLSVKRNGSFALDVLGALIFALSIRTKEFSLGNIAVILLINLLADRQKFRDAVRQLAPYLVVFIVYFIRYAYLEAHKPLDSANPYSLNLNPISIAGNFQFYLSTLFYSNLFGQLWTISITALILTGLAFSTKKSINLFLIGLFGFAAMLGPTLLLPKHRDELYLYAPHFFMALAIGATYSRNRISKITAIAVCIAIFAMPVLAGRYHDIVNYYETLALKNTTQLSSAQRALGPVEKGTRVFITGTTPVFNPFSYGPGSSLRVVYRDSTISVVESPSVDTMKNAFCNSREPKRALQFNDQTGIDITSEMLSFCDNQTKEK